MAVLWYATLAIGVSLCYHRLLTHRSFRVPKWLEYSMAVVGTLALQGGPIQWVSTHRIHHAHTDREGDPHDARRGLLWSHFEWLYRPNEARPTMLERQRFAPDLWSQPFYRTLDNLHVPLQIALGVLLFALGGLPWVVWGIFVRLTLVYHITWFVNSAAHGAAAPREYRGDTSQNHWWIAVLTYGEGWHANHHDSPKSWNFKREWYQLDPGALTILALKTLKLAK